MICEWRVLQSPSSGHVIQYYYRLSSNRLLKDCCSNRFIRSFVRHLGKSADYCCIIIHHPKFLHSDMAGWSRSETIPIWTKRILLRFLAACDNCPQKNPNGKMPSTHLKARISEATNGRSNNSRVEIKFHDIKKYPFIFYVYIPVLNSYLLRIKFSINTNIVRNKRNRKLVIF